MPLATAAPRSIDPAMEIESKSETEISVKLNLRSKFDRRKTQLNAFFKKQAKKVCIF